MIRPFRISPLAATMGAVLCASGCTKTPPPFTGGIRVQTAEEIAEVPNSSFPVPGVLFNGYPQGTPGPNSQGVITYINSQTGPLGYADNPNTVTDVNWLVILNWGTTIPGCGISNAVGYVAPAGGIVDGLCISF